MSQSASASSAAPLTPPQPAVPSSAAVPHPAAAAPDQPGQPAAAPPQTAVQRCSSAYRQAIARVGGPKVPGARDAAENAFRNALPDVYDRTSAAEFIACILKGMVLHVFFHTEGPRLLIGAKAALLAYPPERRPAGRPKSQQLPQN